MFDEVSSKVLNWRRMALGNELMLLDGNQETVLWHSWAVVWDCSVLRLVVSLPN